MKTTYYTVILRRKTPIEGDPDNNRLLAVFQSRREAVTYKERWEDVHKWNPYRVLEKNIVVIEKREKEEP